MADLKRKPSGIFMLEFTGPDADGNLGRRRVSLDTRDPADAKEQRRLWLLGVHPKQSQAVAAKGRAKPAPKPASVTVSRLLDICHRDPEVWGRSKSQATVKSNIKIISARIGDVPVADVTSQTLKDLAAAWKAEGYADGSVKRKMDMVSRALTFALENEVDGKFLLAAKPKVPQVKVRNLKEREVGMAEERSIFAAMEVRREAEPARQWWRFIRFIRILRNTGFRKGEAFALGPSSIVSVQGRLFYRLARYTTKNDKPRMVPVAAEDAAEIDALNGQAVKGRWFPLESVAHHMWCNVRDDVAAGGQHDIADVTLHTWRHTCITRLLRGGMDLVRVSRWAGHSDIKITAERYGHLLADDLLTGLAIIDGPGSGEANPPTPDNRTVPHHEGKRAMHGTPYLQ